MADLVRILSRPIGDETNSVDARELHTALGNGDHFATWIQHRIGQAGLVEGVDYLAYSEPSGKGRPRVEYVLTIDAAKHVSMLERNDKGREVRAYFIAAEKRMRQSMDPVSLLGDPNILRQLLGNYAERVQLLEATVAEQAPKVDVYDRIVESGDTFGFREACQQIKAATGDNENRVRAFMIDRKWIQKLGRGLAPAHTGVERGYTTTRERSWTDPDGASHVRPELRITPKGIARAVELLIASEVA